MTTTVKIVFLVLFSIAVGLLPYFLISDLQSFSGNVIGSASEVSPGASFTNIVTQAVLSTAYPTFIMWAVCGSVILILVFLVLLAKA